VVFRTARNPNLNEPVSKGPEEKKVGGWVPLGQDGATCGRRRRRLSTEEMDENSKIPEKGLRYRRRRKRDGSVSDGCLMGVEWAGGRGLEGQGGIIIINYLRGYCARVEGRLRSRSRRVENRDRRQSADQRPSKAI
jgi:hypothetical protein